MSDEIDDWADLACDLFEAATGCTWEETTEDDARAEGEWCHALWLRLGTLMARQAPPPPDEE